VTSYRLVRLLQIRSISILCVLMYL